MKTMIAIFLIICTLFAMVACVPQEGTTGTSEPSGSVESTDPTEPAVPGKYQLNAAGSELVVDDVGQAAANDTNARVFYQIFVGSFSDSNGDGIGDLRGIINRFDYLNDGKENSGLSLGVEGIWLSPIFLSPSYHKYDVTDYYKVDPQFGTEEDLRELVRLCQERDVKLILDLVVNHTAKNHQWFTYFTNAHKDGDTENKYYDFYSYADKPQGSKTFGTIPGTKEYYECNFSTEMPELNFDNEDVRAEILEVARYYLEDVGVDGFRFDAAKYIYFGEDSRSVEFWEWYLAELRKIKPDVYTVGEVWSADTATYPYFSSTNCFNFTMSQGTGQIATTAKGGDVNKFTAYVEQYLKNIRKENENAMIVPFIANHDTDRAAGFLTVSQGHSHVAANLNLLMPGSPFIYYGEEIGLKGSRGGAQTDANRRLAMLWGDGDTVKDPQGTTYKLENQTNGTVAEQMLQDTSLYTHYKRLIAIRKAHPEIANGEYKALKLTGTRLGGFVSTLDGSSVAVLHNTTAETVTLDLATVPELAGMAISAVAGLNGVTLEGTVLTIEAQTSVVLK